MDKYIQLDKEVKKLSNLKKEKSHEDFNKGKTEICNIINLELIDIQKKIDTSNTEVLYRVRENIAKVKLLLSQINKEYDLLNNDYNSKINSYKFPSGISDLNIKICELGNKLKVEQSERNKLFDKLSCKNMEKESKIIQKNKNEMKFKDKKFRITNNSEILAVIEKKNIILKNKNKILFDLDKKIQSKRTKILNKNNEFNLKIKDLDNKKKNNIGKLENSLKKIEKKNYNNIPNSEEIREREILIINNNISRIEEEYFKQLKISEEELVKDLKSFEGEINNLNEEKNHIEDQYNHSNTLFEEKIKELTCIIPNLKYNNIELEKDINEIDKKLKKINNKIKENNSETSNRELLILEGEREKQETKSISEYEKFKNTYDLKFDELNVKKIRFQKKIENLNNQVFLIENNKHRRDDEYIEIKNYLVNLLKNLKNIN